jgi:hypothetical protein
MATNWQSRLVSAKASIPRRVASTKAFYSQIGPWIDRYKGGMPKGFFAAIGQWESGGSWASGGDPVLGEVGYYQIASSTPPKFGLPPSARKDRETNVFLGGLEYNAKVAEQFLRYPNLVRPGSEDSWKLSRLAFAIGAGGTRTLINASGASPGNAFNAIRSYVDRTGGKALGRQSAGQVWYRVHAVDLQWEIGKKALGGWGGAPRMIPPPPKYPGYDLPPQVEAVLQKGGGPNLLLGLALGGAFAYGTYKVINR